MDDASRIYVGALRAQGESLLHGSPSYCVELEQADTRRRLCDPALRGVMEEMAARCGELVCIARLAVPEGENGRCGQVWDACRLDDVAEPYRAQLVAMSCGGEYAM